MYNTHTSRNNRRSSSGGHTTNRRPSGPNRQSNFRRSSSTSSNSSGRRFGGGRKQQTFDVSKFINKNPVALEAEVAHVPIHEFKDFKLKTELLSNIEKAGLFAPSPIQDQIIPHILEKKDVVGLANTGTGKTAAFLIPLIDLTLRDKTRQTLILTPTRELAIQIDTELRKIGGGMNLFSTICVGGANIAPQIRSLRQKNHFIIGTPGRILDLIERKVLKLHETNTVVLDEADRMLDMGFVLPIKQIIAFTPAEREIHCFSATMAPNIEKLINEVSKKPIIVSVKKKDITNNIEQDVVRYQHHNKFSKLTDLLIKEDFTRVIIFGSMKHSVEKLSQELNKHGIKSDSIHGNKSHPQRQRALKRFKDGETLVLVATDVAARGIHINDVSHVINYDLPQTYEDYVHRIGRTGRGSKHGKALTFVQE